MKICFPRAVIYLVIPFFVFGIASNVLSQELDPLLEEARASENQQRSDQRQADLDRQNQRESENESSLDRESFINLLDADGETFSQQLSVAKQMPIERKVRFPLLSQEQGAEPQQEVQWVGDLRRVFLQTMLDGIIALQKKHISLKAGGDDSLAVLEKDKKNYQLFKKQEDNALLFLEDGFFDQALHCHDIALKLLNCLNGQDLLESDEFAIRFAVVLSQPKQIQEMPVARKKAELLLFEVAQNIQKKIKDHKDFSGTLNLIERYCEGDLAMRPDLFCKAYMDLDDKEKKVAVLEKQREKEKKQKEEIQKKCIVSFLAKSALEKFEIVQADSSLFSDENEIYEFHQSMEKCVSELAKKFRLLRLKPEGFKKLRVFLEEFLELKALSNQLQENIDPKQEYLWEIEGLHAYVKKIVACISSIAEEKSTSAAAENSSTYLLRKLPTDDRQQIVSFLRKAEEDFMWENYVVGRKIREGIAKKEASKALSYWDVYKNNEELAFTIFQTMAFLCGIIAIYYCLKSGG